MKLHLPSLADLGRGLAVAAVNAAARLAERAITAWPNATDDQPEIPEQRTRHTVRTACVRAAADDWLSEYPVPSEAWLQLTTEVND